MPFITGAARLVPPTWPLEVPPVAFVDSVNRTPVFGSATADTSGITRPGHDAFAVTPGPVCQDGRAITFEHQLPAPLHVVVVLYVPGLLVEYVLVPPTETTYWLSDGKPDWYVPASPVEK
jgi:hypothetical protein